MAKQNQFIGATPDEITQMLRLFEADDLDQFYNRIVPLIHQHPGVLTALGKAKSESEVKRIISKLASMNISFDQSASFAGAGHYQRVIPELVGAITHAGEWMTPYTPYQPEVSQGILLTLFDYQSYIASLTGMKVVNAGVYNGSNALVEAALVACRITENDEVLVSEAVHPAAIESLRTYFAPKGINIVIVPTTYGITSEREISERITDKTAAVVIQNPNFWGLTDGIDGQAEVIHSKNVLYIGYGGGDQISLAINKSPIEYGVDIYAGEGQHFGVPVGYGGPHIGALGLASTDRAYIRNLPGRLVIQGEDLEERVRWMLGLQTREQHIKRENATSNACTAETLIAVMATAYLAVMGQKGLTEAAVQSYSLAHYLAQEISSIPGYNVLHSGMEFFDEFTVITPRNARMIVDGVAKRSKVLPGVAITRELPYARSFSNNMLLVTATEANNNMEQLDRLIGGLRRYATSN